MGMYRDILSAGVPRSWLKQLDDLAEKVSLEEGENITRAILVRRAIQKAYDLKVVPTDRTVVKK